MGFPPIPAGAPKNVQNHTFCTLLAQKVRFGTLLAALAGIGRKPHCLPGVAPANQTKERAKTKSSWISPIFVNSGVSPWENKHDSHRTFVPECLREKFMNWPFFGLVCRGDSWLFAQTNYLAISALWLVLKFTRQALLRWVGPTLVAH